MDVSFVFCGRTYFCRLLHEAGKTDAVAYGLDLKRHPWIIVKTTGEWKRPDGSEVTSLGKAAMKALQI